MYCSNCGEHIPDEKAKFCPNCGNKTFSSVDISHSNENNLNTEVYGENNSLLDKYESYLLKVNKVIGGGRQKSTLPSFSNVTKISQKKVYTTNMDIDFFINSYITYIPRVTKKDLILFQDESISNYGKTNKLHWVLSVVVSDNINKDAIEYVKQQGSSFNRVVIYDLLNSKLYFKERNNILAMAHNPLLNSYINQFKGNEEKYEIPTAHKGSQSLQIIGIIALILSVILFAITHL